MFKKIMDNKRERLFTGFGSMGLSVSLGLTVLAWLSVCVCVCVCVFLGVHLQAGGLEKTAGVYDVSRVYQRSGGHGRPTRASRRSHLTQPAPQILSPTHLRK